MCTAIGTYEKTKQYKRYKHSFPSVCTCLQLCLCVPELTSLITLSVNLLETTIFEHGFRLCGNPVIGQSEAMLETYPSNNSDFNGDIA